MNRGLHPLLRHEAPRGERRVQSDGRLRADGRDPQFDALDADGTHLYVTSPSRHTVSVISTDDGSVRTVSVGTDPSWVEKVLVTDDATNTQTVIEFDRSGTTLLPTPV